MQFDYSRAAATADRLIRRYGAEAKLKFLADPSYDTGSGSGTTTDNEQTCSAVVFPYGDTMVDGKLIKAQDQQAFVSAVDLPEPQPGDVFTWKSTALTVVKAKNLGPASLMVVYELQVRA